MISNEKEGKAPNPDSSRSPEEKKEYDHSEDRVKKADTPKLRGGQRRVAHPDQQLRRLEVGKMCVVRLPRESHDKNLYVVKITKADKRLVEFQFYGSKDPVKLRWDRKYVPIWEENEEYLEKRKRKKALEAWVNWDDLVRKYQGGKDYNPMLREELSTELEYTSQPFELTNQGCIPRWLWDEFAAFVDQKWIGGATPKRHVRAK